MLFEWDPVKAASNVAHHGVTFDEATTVFGDELSVSYVDPYTVDESRYILIGNSSANRFLIVVHTERGDKIRIISARKLTPKERRHYERFR